MALDWIPRGPKDQRLSFQIAREDLLQKTEPPRTTYEKRPLTDSEGKEIEGLYVAWVTLDNERMGNSYTLDMLAGTACAFDKAAHDPSVLAVILTGAGDRFFCTGGNTKEYAEYFVGRPFDCQEYMSVYWRIFDSVWHSSKPFIRRVNGMSVAGGEEIGGVCDYTIASDLADFVQAGPRHGSTPMGGACQFKSVNMTIEDAMWHAIMCEPWSAYKMYRKNYITDVQPVLKQNGQFIQNPGVITDKYVEDGKIVYGEYKTGDEAKQANEMIKSLPKDMSLLDKSCMDLTWKFANLYPHQLAQSLSIIRSQKRVAYERDKEQITWWWAANASLFGEFDMGMTAFNTSKMTGSRDADIIKYRQMVAKGHPLDAELFEAVMPKPQQK